MILWQIGVEDRGDKTNEGAPLLRHDDLATVAAHDARRTQGVESRDVRRAGLRIDIDGEVAHQPFDDRPEWLWCAPPHPDFD
jgi:hypothetical protein